MKHFKFSRVSDFTTNELLSSDLVAPLITLHRSYYPADISCEYHQIDSFYTALIVKGEMTYQERGQAALTGRRGDLFILSAGNDYCWNVTMPMVALQCRHSGFSILEYGISGSIFGTRNYPVSMVHLGEAATTSFEAEIERTRNCKARNFYFSSAILYLFAEVASQISEVSSKGSSDQQLAAHCAAYIDKRLTGLIDISRMAHDCKVSKRKLFLLFQTHFGMPPLRYIAIRKIEQARKMILNTSLSNDEIAAALGFSDTNYFIRFFKKHTGASPMRTRHVLKSQRN